MKINSCYQYNNTNFNYKQTFKGCDARPLKAVVAGNYRSICQSDYRNWLKVLKEISEIFAKEKNIDCLIMDQDGTHPVKSFLDAINYTKDGRIDQWHRYLWMQDYITISPNKKMCAESFNKYDESFANDFGLIPCSVDRHVAGGNLFFVNNGNEDILLIGNHILKRFNEKQLNELKETFNIEKCYTISQPDFHIDLGIRPLNNKNILVNDSEMMIEILKQYILKAKDYLLINPNDSSVQKVLQNLKMALKRHSSNIKKSNLVDANQLSRELTALGFNPIRVPAALVNDFVRGNDWNHFSHYVYDANFMNSIIHERPDKSLLYLTNQPIDTICTDAESCLGAKKIGFDLKTIFEEAVKEYINKSNIHYLSTQEMLKNRSGGLHCMFAEVPN